MKSKFNTFIGQKLNRLTVISKPFVKREKWGQNIKYVKAECDCKEENKNQIEVREYYFLTGMVKSCGCIHKEKMRVCHGVGQNNAKWESPNEISQEFYSSAKKMAHKRKFDWTIDINYLYDIWIEQNGFCNLSNVKLSLFKSRQFFGRTYQSASVDRVNSKLGYIKGNIHWTHKCLNLMKWHFSIDYFINNCNLVTNFKNDNLSHEFEYLGQNRKYTWKGNGLIEGEYLSDLKKQAERRNKKNRKTLITFEITPRDVWLQFIYQHGRCALTGQMLIPIKRTIINGKRCRIGNASIDRIDSKLGYTTSNIQWVHKDINLMKRDLSVYDFKLWCALVSYHQINKSKL